MPEKPIHFTFSPSSDSSPICLTNQLTQVPVGQCVVVVVIVVYVLVIPALPSFMLQGDGARLVETRLYVLITVGHFLIFLHISLDKHTLYFSCTMLCIFESVKKKKITTVKNIVIKTKWNKSCWLLCNHFKAQQRLFHLQATHTFLSTRL